MTLGRCLVYRFDADDLGMRNLAIVALTDAGRRFDEVAAVFGLTATYASMLRGQARREGSAGWFAAPADCSLPAKGPAARQCSTEPARLKN